MDEIQILSKVTIQESGERNGYCFEEFLQNQFILIQKTFGLAK